MPAIKRRALEPPDERVILRLTNQNYRVLAAYSAFLQEAPDYVVNQLVETVLGRDKEFTKWRAEHPDDVAEMRRRRPAQKAALSERPTPAEGGRGAPKAPAAVAAAGGR